MRVRCFDNRRTLAEFLIGIIILWILDFQYILYYYLLVMLPILYVVLYYSQGVNVYCLV